MRWTMPGRFSPPMPDRLPPKWCRSALTSVPVGEPGAGCTTMPAGLFTTIRSASSCTMSSGMASATVSTSAASSTEMATASPSARVARAFVTTAPFTATAPASIRRARRERLRLSASGTSRPSALSRRGAGSGPIRNSTRRVGNMGQSPEEDETTALPRDLRFLKTLVTVLTVVMIAGVITITALLVIRLNGGAAPVTIAPGDFEIPAGVGVLGISVVTG
jgi:uncharacterized integral membrane protein